MKRRAPPLFDWTLFWDWAGFTWRALRRHPMVGAAAFVLTLALAVAAAAFLPRKYVSSTKLLARPTSYMASIANPNAPWSDEAPMRAARERVLARDSLTKIAQDTNLVAEWQKGRSPILRMKDQLQQLIGGGWTGETWSEIVVGTLEKRLQVSADYETVEIAVEWPDAAMARRIVEAASRNFVESRHVTEVEAMTEAIGILEVHAAQTDLLIQEAVGNLRRVVAERSRGDSRVLARAAANAPSRPRAVTSQELAQLKFMLRSKQNALESLQEQRARELTRARATLEQQQVVFNRSHPAITELERQVKALERPSPQMVQLKRDVIDLERDLEERGGKVDRSARRSNAPAQTTGLVSEASLANLPPELERDPAISVAQEQVRVALGRHQELLMRIGSARMALDTARAAFKYRFHAVKPAQTPKVALAPNVPAILAAGLFVGIVLAFFAAAAVDLWKRTLAEAWQVRRMLKVPLLVELKGPIK